MNFIAARTAMIESQVRPNGVTDQRILDAMSAIAREEFVPESCRAIAYVDEDIQLLHSPFPRCLVEPMAFARLVQLAEVKPTDNLLHIGAATGYGTAVLARLAAKVTAVECDEQLITAARSNLAGIANVSMVPGPLADGAKSHAPFDVVFIEGRIGDLPQSLVEQTVEGGRLVGVLGQSEAAKAFLWVAAGRAANGRPAFEASVAALPGFEKRKAPFHFDGFNGAPVG